MFRIQAHRAPLAIAVAIACAFLLLECMWEWRLYNREIDDAEMQSLNLATSLTQHAEDTFDLANTSLLGIVERVETDGTSAHALPRLNGFMKASLSEQARVSGLFVYDASGDWVASTAPPIPAMPNNKDRPYFKHHEASYDRGTFIGEPIRSRSGGQWIITLTRRWNKPDGSFGGVVLASVNVEYFSKFYERFSIGEQGIVALLNQHGGFLSRRPFTDATSRLGVNRTDFRARLKEAPSGIRRYVSPLDGVERVSGYYSGQRYPVVVLVAFGRDEVLAIWKREAAVRFAAMVIGSVLIIVAGKMLAGTARRRVEAEAALAESERNFRLLAENASDMVSRLDLNGRRIYVSPASRALLGYDPEELIGSTFASAIHPDDLPHVQEQEAVLREGRASAVTASFRTKKKDGTEIWVEAAVHLVHSRTGSVEGVVAVARDVTDRKILEHQLDHMARIDQLTRIANRRAFDEALCRAWRHSAQTMKPISLLMIDVDHFKRFNDAYGHPQGDECLREIARLLSDCVGRSDDLVARYGGEEFAVILPNTNENGAGSLAERMRLKVFESAVPHIHSETGRVTVSIGVASLPAAQRDGDPSHLVQAADQALYAAKAAMRNTVVVASEMLASMKIDDVGISPSRSEDLEQKLA